MKDQHMPKADFFTAIILLIFSITILILSIQMPRMEQVGADPYSAPGIVPGFLGAILLCLGTILLIRSILRKGHHLAITQNNFVSFFKNEGSVRVLLTIAISVLYGGILLGTIPYVLATFLYVIGFILLFEYRRDRSFYEQRKTIIFAFLLAFLVTSGVAAVFRYLFLVKLP